MKWIVYQCLNLVFGEIVIFSRIPLSHKDSPN